MGEKMAGTNEFALFRCKSICTGGGPKSGRKKFEKCLPAGTGTKTLRAKGTLISEPRFSAPCEMRFFPREKGKNCLFLRKALDKGRFPFLAWEKSHLAGGRKSGLTN